MEEACQTKQQVPTHHGQVQALDEDTPLHPFFLVRCTTLLMSDSNFFRLSVWGWLLKVAFLSFLPLRGRIHLLLLVFKEAWGILYPGCLYRKEKLAGSFITEPFSHLRSDKFTCNNHLEIPAVTMLTSDRVTSPRPAWATQPDPVSKQNITKQQTSKKLTGNPTENWA